MPDPFGESLPRLTRPVVRSRVVAPNGRRVRVRCPDCGKALSQKAVTCPGCVKFIQWVEDSGNHGP